MKPHLPSPRVTPAPRLPAQAWQVWLLLAFMLAFQGLGQSHRIAHSPGWVRAVQPAGFQGLLAPGASLKSKALTVASAEAWGHQRGELVCLLLDQLSHDHAPLASPGLPHMGAVFGAPGQVVAVPLHLAARWKRAARGPPGVV